MSLTFKFIKRLLLDKSDEDRPFYYEYETPSKEDLDWYWPFIGYNKIEFKETLIKSIYRDIL